MSSVSQGFRCERCAHRFVVNLAIVNLTMLLSTGMAHSGSEV
jgi:hypothetical protein